MNKIAKPISLSQGLAYSAPIVITSFLITPVAAIIPGIYAQYFGLSLTVIATVLFSARLFDAVTDPLIGYLSDRHQARTGTRKPFVVVGSIALVISCYFLYSPPENVSALYFLIWYFALYLAWTLVEIPHLAWGSELAPNTQDKTRIYSIRNACVFIGTMAFTMLPLLPFFTGKGFTPETLTWSFLAGAVLMCLALFVCINKSPNAVVERQTKGESLQLLRMSIAKNKPFLLLVFGHLATTVGQGMTIGLGYIFISSYLGLTEQAPIIYSFSGVIGLIAVMAIYKLSGVFKKKLGWGMGVILMAIGIAGKAFLDPGIESFIPYVIFLSVFSFGFALMNIFSQSLLSDVTDYGRWKFGVNHTSFYFSIYAFLTKFGYGVGGALGLGLAGWYGFDPAATAHTEEGVFGLRVAMTMIPPLFLMITLISIVFMPIDARRHGIIQRRITSRI